MMKYKVGDKVILEAEVQNTVDDVLILKFADGHTDRCIEGFVLASTDAYNKGLQDAWELARKIYEIPREDWYNIFHIEDCFMIDILTDFTPQEALDKIEAYEESKAIKVGDVVKVKTGAGSEHLGVVTQITANQNCACIVYADGSTEMNTANNMTKTNKHLDIEHLLEQIRGNE